MNSVPKKSSQTRKTACYAHSHKETYMHICKPQTERCKGMRKLIISLERQRSEGTIYIYIIQQKEKSEGQREKGKLGNSSTVAQGGGERRCTGGKYACTINKKHITIQTTKGNVDMCRRKGRAGNVR
ncbi:hypothetical protein, unlikely [Trypanosoma brucei gambiense DAL972]|uniref:Uncharacterized protein n=1 Tax=Trypanosoma brucei gambiense (strain MHOM/CI/86/DAL972) TaxID=679716 RepID=C9ZTV7_TRYB9|nr:hypothetical protein, unlikely [Trypanosoma brucei gambiense DAL972]CBH12843.1 hypothetical protein, unlikely [Trypanosoma brucei gambiense DAL972]|eukprot:XP_011775122.1 hypothetical protein, unlikely [Trypanosoma brucei gambiense DAL972]